MYNIVDDKANRSNTFYNKDTFLVVVHDMFLMFLPFDYNPCWSCFTGDQDARVLTLAEQIIAAIPDRIKVRSVFINIFNII